MQIPLALFLAWTIAQYNLNKMVLDAWVYIKMRRAVWGLPQADILVNKRLRRKLALFGYYESVNTPGLWRHESQPLTFTLVVDDFGVKFMNEDDVNHLIPSSSTTYKLTKDWTSNLYCVSRSSGIMSHALSTSQCKATSKQNCKNMNM
jgi:hypothetical protein